MKVEEFNKLKIGDKVKIDGVTAEIISIGTFPRDKLRRDICLKGEGIGATGRSPEDLDGTRDESDGYYPGYWWYPDSFAEDMELVK